MGLILKAVPTEELEDEVMKLATRYERNAGEGGGRGGFSVKMLAGKKTRGSGFTWEGNPACGKIGDSTASSEATQKTASRLKYGCAEGEARLAKPERGPSRVPGPRKKLLPVLVNLRVDRMLLAN